MGITASALLVVTVPLFLALIGAIIYLAKLSRTLAMIVKELGDHKSGIKGRLHDNAQALLKLDGRVSLLEERIKK